MIVIDLSFRRHLRWPAAAAKAYVHGFIADCGLWIADFPGEYLAGKKSAIRNPQSAMATAMVTAISHHDIDPPPRNVWLPPESQVACQ